MLGALVTALFLAQAEPLPAPSAPLPAPPLPAQDSDPSTTPNTFTLHARFAYRVGDPGRALGPAPGFSLGGSFERRYAALARARVELGGAVEFFYDQFWKQVDYPGVGPTGAVETYQADRQISYTSFAVAQTAALRAGRVRPWLSVGAGVSIAYLSTPETALAPGTSTALLPFGRAALGLEIAIKRNVGLVVRADYTMALRSPSFTPRTGPPLVVFGDVVGAGVGLSYRF